MSNTKVELTVTEPWPHSVLFNQDSRVVNFGSPEEITSWAAREFQFWQRQASGLGGNLAAGFSENLGFANRVRQAPPEKAVEQLDSIAGSYWLSNGALATLIDRIPVPVHKALVFNEVSKLAPEPQFQLEPDLITAKAYAALYWGLRRDIGAFDEAADFNEKLKRSSVETTALRVEHVAALQQFRELLVKCDKEWNDKIAGFVQRQALEAPKAYWSSRAEKHAKSAKGERTAWSWTLVVAAVGVSAALYLTIGHQPGDDLISEVVGGVQHIIVFGTLLAFAVWWLRQKLRDLRVHEHLADDASERVTMIETYAALRAGGLQDANMTPILNALYRPAGSPADDTGPVMPTEILLKTVAEAVKK